jgi:hypothetical protein
VTDTRDQFFKLRECAWQTVLDTDLPPGFEGCRGAPIEEFLRIWAESLYRDGRQLVAVLVSGSLFRALTASLRPGDALSIWDGVGLRFVGPWGIYQVAATQEVDGDKLRLGSRPVSIGAFAPSVGMQISLAEKPKRKRRNR